MCLIYNNSPHSAIQASPVEAMGTHAPFGIERFVKFGSRVFFLIPKEKRQNKLQPTSEEGIFLGYVDEMHAYLVWSKLKAHKVRTIRATGTYFSKHDLNMHVDFDLTAKGDLDDCSFTESDLEQVSDDELFRINADEVVPDSPLSLPPPEMETVSEKKGTVLEKKGTVSEKKGTVSEKKGTATEHNIHSQSEKGSVLSDEDKVASPIEKIVLDEEKTTSQAGKDVDGARPSRRDWCGTWCLHGRRKKGEHLSCVKCQTKFHVDCLGLDTNASSFASQFPSLADKWICFECSESPGALQSELNAAVLLGKMESNNDILTRKSMTVAKQLNQLDNNQELQRTKGHKRTLVLAKRNLSALVKSMEGQASERYRLALLQKGEATDEECDDTPIEVWTLV